MFNIDLSKYEVRTDILLESIDIKALGENYKEESIDGIKTTSVLIDKSFTSKLNKKEGIYVTLEFDDITDTNRKEQVKKSFQKSIKIILDKINIKEDSSCLIVGLGNSNSTPDSLGPKAIENILVTRHLFVLDGIQINEGFRNVSAFSPGVMGETGIETVDYIKSIVEKIKPDFLIVIDALASMSLSRVNKTIQITTTGIHPGSGVGNSRKEISEETLGIPVIAVGIPTVVDAVTIVKDTLNYTLKHFSYNKENIDNKRNKLIPKNKINYLKDKNMKDLSQEEKIKLMGIIGDLEENEIRELLHEVLSPIGYNLMVTPKEVDFIIEKLSDIISGGINNALHKKVTEF